MENIYDIFISYKRKSLPTANNLYYRLTTRGYSTFFDLEEMRRDNFNVQLLNYIENAKDVFVILEEGSLDGCKKENWEEEDWFCHEIAFALEKNKNIIPILLGNYKMPSADFFPDKLKEFSLKHSPDFSFSFFDAYLDKLIEKKFITSEAHVQNKATSVFKFYSNENCQVFKEGKLVCSLEGMSDEPYYLPVPRKGDYRFKVMNNLTSECRILNEEIDAVEEKNIEIIWNSGFSIKNHFQGRRKGWGITISILLLLAVVFISLSLLRTTIGNPSLVQSPSYTSTTDTVCIPVDLGLPSGTLWGDRNIGANSPTDYGDYYVWGKTQKDTICRSRSNGTNESIVHDCARDVVTRNLGEKWSLPTADQVKELIENCYCEWVTDHGISGCRFTSKSNHKEIFFPAAGCIKDSIVRKEKYYGYYWTGESNKEDPSQAKELFFLINDIPRIGNGYKNFLYSIRGVFKEEQQ